MTCSAADSHRLNAHSGRSHGDAPPAAGKHGVTIETAGDTTRSIGSHALLLQMTTNLVHNATVYNRGAPIGRRVWVCVLM